MMKNKLLISTASASILLSILSILSKGIGMVREIIYAHHFGLSSRYDIFLACSIIPIVINTGILFLTQHYFIPIYNKQKQKGEQEVHFLLNYTFWLFIFVGLLLAILLFFFSKIIISSYLSGLNTEQMKLGMQIFIIFLFTIPLNAGYSVISAYRQAEFSFIYPAVTQIVLNVVIIIIVFFFASYLNIVVLPYAFLMGYIVAFVLIVKPYIKILVPDFKKFLNAKTDHLAWSNLFFLILIEISSLSYVIVDRYFIDELSPGGIAALNYAFVIFSLPVSVFSITLSTTVFSKFALSYLYSTEKLIENLKTALGITAFVIVPVSFLLYSLGGFFLKIFYERGAFTPADTLITHQALKYYLIGLVFHSAYAVLLKLYYSLNFYKAIMWISIAAFLLKVILNRIFIGYLSQNGLALSTSLIFIFLFISTVFMLKKTTLNKKTAFIKWQIIYYFVSAVVAAVMSFLVAQLLGLGEITRWILFIAFYVLNSLLMRDQEMKLFISSFFNFMKLKF